LRKRGGRFEVFFGLEEEKKKVRDVGLKRDNSTFQVEGGLV
jgi:hypothetical protein